MKWRLAYRNDLSPEFPKNTVTFHFHLAIIVLCDASNKIDCTFKMCHLSFCINCDNSRSIVHPWGWGIGPIFLVGTVLSLYMSYWVNHSHKNLTLHNHKQVLTQRRGCKHLNSGLILAIFRKFWKVLEKGLKNVANTIYKDNSFN